MSVDGVAAYPLSWPMGWMRTAAHQRKISQFASRSLATARDFTLDELRLLKARNAIISTNIILRNDGLPRSGQRQPSDPGVAVYFALDGRPKVLACDRWTTVEDNLWAIGKHIEALRGQARWGVGTLAQSFRGYDTLPAPAMAWWEVLKVDQKASVDEITAAYRHRAKETHPDTGGSEEEFIRVQKAFENSKRGDG